MTPTFRKIPVLTLCILGGLATGGRPIQAAGIPPGTGLVAIVSPANGVVVAQPGATTVQVHLEVAFGNDLAGTPADPATFTAGVSGMKASALLPLFTDVKDADGHVTGKKADVTLPLKKKYSFHAKVASILPPGATKPVKGSAKVGFVPVPPSAPLIQNFRISNAIGATSGGKPVVNVGQSVHVQADLSSPDGEAIVSYSLDRGDGSTPITRSSSSGLTAVDELVVYSSFGDFTATLKVANASSQSATQTLDLHVNTLPTAKLKINPTQSTFNYPVTFDALDGGDADGDALTYTFNFGDGSAPVTGPSPTVTYTYPDPGVTKRVYTATLTVTDAYGTSATTRSSLAVFRGLSGSPMLQITSPLSGETASVTNNVLSVDVALGKASSGADPDPTAFKATLNRIDATGYFSVVKDPKRNNAVVGMHGAIPASQVKMGGLTNSLYCRVKSVVFTSTGGTVRTLEGYHTTGFKASAVTLQPPTASFTATPSETQVNQPVAFDASASASNPPGKPLTFAWDFGDGIKASASSSPTITHAYTADGPYTVTLTVSDGALSVTATDSVSVRAVVTTGNPALTVSVPQSPGNALDFGDLSGSKNLYVTSSPPMGHPYNEIYPAWVEKCVEVTNTGTGTLTVSSVSIDNPAFQVSNASQITQVKLAAGESYFVGVRFNPRPYTPGGAAPAPAAPGSQSGTLTIVTNASSNGTQTVPLTGNVVSGVPTSNIRLMRSDMHRAPDDSANADQPVVHQLGDASVLDMGLVAVSQSFLFGGVVNEGDVPGTITGVDVLDDQGQPSPDFSAQLAHLLVGLPNSSWTTPESAIGMDSGASLENRFYSPFLRMFIGDFIQVTFHPTNTAAALQRLSARMIIHTDSGVDQVVGLTGIGVDAPLYQCQSRDFEFARTSPGNTTTNLYESSEVSPAVLTVQNVGREAGTLTPSIAGINGGPSSGFRVSPASLPLAPSASGTFTLTFAPPTTGHFAGVLKIGTDLPSQPSKLFLLHGYGRGGTGMLGAAANWYTYDDSDFDQTEMIALDKTGTQSHFSQLDGLQDPFEISGNTVDMGQYGGDWSELVMLAGREYTIDGAVFGPYSPTTPGLNSVATKRLQSGQPIYTGGIESNAGFLAFTPSTTDGHWDIQSEGADAPRLDVTPDGILFYTTTASSNAGATTALKWWNLSTKTGGVAAADVAGLFGVPNDEVLDMRAIKLSSGGYRVLVVFDDMDASNHQIVGDMDLSSVFAVTTHKNLTGTLSSGSNDNADGDGNQPILIDANGLSYTSTTVQNADGTSTMKVLRENLHADTGATTFGSVTVNFGDSDAGELLLDNQGNVFLMTNDGICAFSSTGTFLGYVMKGHTYYADNFAGGSVDGSDTQDLGDFTTIWLNK